MKDKNKERKFVLGRGCKTRGFIMDDGSFFHCGDKECQSCNQIFEAVDKELKKQIAKGTFNWDIKDSKTLAERPFYFVTPEDEEAFDKAIKELIKKQREK